MTNMSIVKIDNYYMVKRGYKYYKLGLVEGRILKEIINGQSLKKIAIKENLSENRIQQLEKEFYKVGILGEMKKEKKNLLFFKIPLLEIDNLMGNICKFLKNNICLLKVCILIWLFFVFVGVSIVVLDYKDIFQKESIVLPGYQYLLVYISYFVIILFHELSHGIMCKYFGGRVGKLGVALIVFNPAMYCDISSVRLFDKKYKKVWCSAAGFMTNAFFVGFFSLIYKITNLTFCKMMILLNITSIMFNAIPFIRLDGYWILSFIVNIDNLYKKSLRKIRFIQKENRLEDWKDYFILIYGVLNVLVLSYFLITFVLSVVQLIGINI